MDLNVLLDPDNSDIKGDILQIIIEYLNHEKLHAASHVLQDEVQMRQAGINQKKSRSSRLTKHIMSGDWENAIKILSTIVPKQLYRCFSYTILRQQYFELIDNHEYDMAFAFLKKSLKPLEDVSNAQGVGHSEFNELCYLLTCNSVCEGNGFIFKEWKHFYHQREIVAKEISIAIDNYLNEDMLTHSNCFISKSLTSHLSSKHVPRTFPHTPNAQQHQILGEKASVTDARLIYLFKQALAYQVLASNRHVHSVATASCDTETTTNLHIDKDMPPNSNLSRNVSNSSDHDSSPIQKEDQQLVSCPPATAIPCATHSNSKFPLVRSLLDDYQPVTYPDKIMAVLCPLIQQDGNKNIIISNNVLVANGNNNSNSSNSFNASTDGPFRPPLNTSILKVTCMTFIGTPKNETASFSSVSSSGGKATLSFGNNDGITVFGGTESGILLQWYLPNKVDTDKAIYDSSEDTSNSSRQRNSASNIPVSCPIWNMKLRGIEKRNNEWIPSSTATSGSTATTDAMLNKKKTELYPPKIRDVVSNGSGTLLGVSLSDGSVVLVKQSYASTAMSRSTAGLMSSNQPYRVHSSIRRGGSSWSINHGISSSSSMNVSIASGAVGSGTGSGSDVVTEVERISVHQGDAYSSHLFPDSQFLVSGGFDGNVVLIDVNTLAVLKTFKGHHAAITQVGATRTGNLVYSSSRDGTVKFWDLLSGICVQTLVPNRPHTSRQDVGHVVGSSRYQDSSPSAGGDHNQHSFGLSGNAEVTSATLSYDNKYLLTSSRFSQSRLIDLRTSQVVAKYKLPQNNNFEDANSFYKTSFCAGFEGVACGTANGGCTIWNAQSGNVINSLSMKTSGALSFSYTSNADCFTRRHASALSGAQQQPVSVGVPVLGGADLSRGSAYVSNLMKSITSRICCDIDTGVLACMSSNGITMWQSSLL